MANFCARCATDIGIPVSTGEGFCEGCTKPLPPDDMWERIWVDPEFSEFRCDKLEPSHNHTLYVRADLYADLRQQRDDLLKRLKQSAKKLTDVVTFLDANDLTPEMTAVWDDSECDGGCLRDECADAAAEARQLIQRCEVSP